MRRPRRKKSEKQVEKSESDDEGFTTIPPNYPVDFDLGAIESAVDMKMAELPTAVLNVFKANRIYLQNNRSKRCTNLWCDICGLRLSSVKFAIKHLDAQIHRDNYQTAKVMHTLFHLPPISTPHRNVLNATLEDTIEDNTLSDEAMNERQSFAYALIRNLEAWFPNIVIRPCGSYWYNLSHYREPLLLSVVSLDDASGEQHDSSDSVISSGLQCIFNDNDSLPLSNLLIQEGYGYLLNKIYEMLEPHSIRKDFTSMRARTTSTETGLDSTENNQDQDGIPLLPEIYNLRRVRDKSFYLTLQDSYGRTCHILADNQTIYDFTILINTYVNLHPQVKKLGILFRNFAELAFIDMTSHGMFDSLVFPLLVIFYLQHTKPALIPNLHQLYEKHNHILVSDCVHPVFINGQDLSFVSNSKVAMDLWKSDQQDNAEPSFDLTDLWLGFLRFYIFDFKRFQFAVDIVRSDPVKIKRGGRHSLTVNDPFDPKRNLCANIGTTGFDYINAQFQAAYAYFGIPRRASDGQHVFTRVRLAQEQPIDIPPIAITENENLDRFSIRVIHLTPIIDEVDDFKSNLNKLTTTFAERYLLIKQVGEIKDDSFGQTMDCVTSTLHALECRPLCEILPRLLTSVLEEIVESDDIPDLVKFCIDQMSDDPLILGTWCNFIESNRLAQQFAYEYWHLVYKSFITNGTFTVGWRKFAKRTLFLYKRTVKNWLLKREAEKDKKSVESITVSSNTTADNGVKNQENMPSGGNLTDLNPVEHGSDLSEMEDVERVFEPITEDNGLPNSAPNVPVHGFFHAENHDNLEEDESDEDGSSRYEELRDHLNEDLQMSSTEEVEEQNMDEGFEFDGNRSHMSHDEYWHSLDVDADVDDARMNGQTSANLSLNQDEKDTSDPHEFVGLNSNEESQLCSASTLEVDGQIDADIIDGITSEAPSLRRFSENSQSDQVKETASNKQPAKISKKALKRARKAQKASPEAPKPVNKEKVYSWDDAILARSILGLPIDDPTFDYYNSKTLACLREEDLSFPFRREVVCDFVHDSIHTSVLGLAFRNKPSTLLAHFSLPRPQCQACGAYGHLTAGCTSTRHTTISFQVWHKFRDAVPKPADSQLTALSNCLEQLAKHHETEQYIESRNLLVRELAKVFAHRFPHVQLELFGSCANGFDLNSSDLDLCVFFPKGSEEWDELQSKRSLVTIMKKFRNILYRWQRKLGITSIQALLRARVPILKITFNHSIEADISFNNYLAMRNTRMLKLYSELEPRLRILGVALKTVIKITKIGNAAAGGISSYACIIMLIHYLQQKDQLPILQELYEHKDCPVVIVNGWNAWYQDDLKSIYLLWKPTRPKLQLAELWLGFFHYYLFEFDHDTYVVTIRQKELLDRFLKMWSSLFAVEDPFNLSHNLTSGLRHSAVLDMLNVFHNVLLHHTTFIPKSMPTNEWHYCLFAPQYIGEQRSLPFSTQRAKPREECQKIYLKNKTNECVRELIGHFIEPCFQVQHYRIPPVNQPQQLPQPRLFHPQGLRVGSPRAQFCPPQLFPNSRPQQLPFVRPNGDRPNRPYQFTSPNQPTLFQVRNTCALADPPAVQQFPLGLNINCPRMNVQNYRWSDQASVNQPVAVRRTTFPVSMINRPTPPKNTYVRLRSTQDGFINKRYPVDQISNRPPHPASVPVRTQPNKAPPHVPDGYRNKVALMSAAELGSINTRNRPRNKNNSNGNHNNNVHCSHSKFYKNEYRSRKGFTRSSKNMNNESAGPQDGDIINSLNNLNMQIC